MIAIGYGQEAYTNQWQAVEHHGLLHIKKLGIDMQPCTQFVPKAAFLSLTL